MNERIAAITQTLIVAIVGWVGYAVVELKTEVAAMKATLTVAADDRYRRADAQRDFANALEHRMELQRRVEVLEHKVESIHGK